MKLFLSMLSLAVLVALMGCQTVVVKKYDAAGNLVEKTEITSPLGESTTEAANGYVAVTTGQFVPGPYNRHYTNNTNRGNSQNSRTIGEKKLIAEFKNRGVEIYYDGQFYYSNASRSRSRDLDRILILALDGVSSRVSSEFIRLKKSATIIDPSAWH